MRLSTLCGKEVINLSDGARLGVIGECELMFDERTGNIMSIVLPNKSGLFNLFGDSRCVNVPWDTLKRVGDEVLIVELNTVTERRVKYMFEK
jgi:YlmC/YmxH family sporulation protein